ncbi:facilitated trehalose transporter Tret1-like isoform X1 [Leptidea sinapis]|uniref:facilitated trehalose transporter Tret1-like isoform X1 n=1 Tax=Leptidea sinapis TaxID=189913 RepID=UPI0021335E00|nr:facilitated trehalose transporter Tret1-like isoform X1 [Leptidea sinapis]
MKLNMVDEKQGHTYYQWIYASVASIGFMLFGMEAGWLSPITKTLQSEHSPLGYPLSSSTISLCASVTAISSAFTVFLYSYLVDKYGRKWIIFAITIPQALSIIMRIMFPNVVVLLIARSAAGISASGVFTICTIYTREISQSNMIGRLGSLQVVLQFTGFLIIYLIGAFFEYFTVLWIFLAFPITMAVLMISAPEAPAYLVKSGKIDDAYKTVAFLRGVKTDDKVVVNEINEMQKQEEEFNSMSTIGMRTIIRDKSWRQGLIIMLATFTLHSWNGAFAILTYASAILSSTGNVFDISPQLQTISFPIVMIIASLSLTGVAERFGRRVLLAAGFLISGLALTALGVAMLVKQYGYVVPSWLPITSMMVAVAMYAGSVRPLPYVISTEMFNFQVRAKVMGSIVTYGWVIVATQLFAYGPLTATCGLHVTFICYGIINFLGVIMCYIMPETKGRTDQEIRHALAHPKSKTISKPT